MKVGFNLLLWATHVADAGDVPLDALKAAGYDGVEVPIFEGPVSHFSNLARSIADAGLAATGITVLPPGRNCLSADPAERQAALDHIRWAADCTAALGGNLLCGPFHQPLGQFSGRGPTPDEMARCAEVHRAAASHAATLGVQLSVEPLNRFECYCLNTAAQTIDLVEAVGADNYGYLYDTFHAHIEEKNQAGAIRLAGGIINHVHVSENDRGVPGSGQVDLLAAFEALKSTGYDGWLTIEAFGQALPDLAAATRVWRPLFADPVDVYTDGIAVIRRLWAAA